MVSAYLDVAEINALNMHAMTMKEWVKELDGFLTMTHKEILQGAGKISHEEALKKAHRPVLPGTPPSQALYPQSVSSSGQPWLI